LVIGVLFVCMGNICRSPTAEGVFVRRARAEGLDRRLRINSCATHAYHIGRPPDARAIAAAAARGIDLSGQRARQIAPADFAAFDYLLAMDRDNLADLRARAPRGHEDKPRLLLDFAPEAPVREVPDPYYGGPDGFSRVLDLIEAASAGLMADIHARLGDGSL